jgi:hypothetical protein
MSAKKTTLVAITEAVISFKPDGPLKELYTRAELCKAIGTTQRRLYEVLNTAIYFGFIKKVAKKRCVWTTIFDTESVWATGARIDYNPMKNSPIQSPLAQAADYIHSVMKVGVPTKLADLANCKTRSYDVLNVLRGFGLVKREKRTCTLLKELAPDHAVEIQRRHRAKNVTRRYRREDIDDEYICKQWQAEKRRDKKRRRETIPVQKEGEEKRQRLEELLRTPMKQSASWIPPLEPLFNMV